MTAPARGVARTLVALALTMSFARGAAAQPTVTLSGVAPGGPITHLTPTFVIDTAGFPAGDPIASLRLQVGVQSDLGGPPILDTTVFSAPASIRLPRPLPDDTPLYWRATARTGSGLEIASATAGPRVTIPWLALVSPDEPNGTTIGNRQPRLVWSAGTVDSPPGPRRFRVEVLNAGTRQVVAFQTTADTSVVLPVPLEANTPYRWRVTARFGPLDSVTVESRATFVVIDSDAPLATLLYQTFPNPFPTSAAQSACIWFDLHEPTSVTLAIHDLRGALVRRLIPSNGLGSPLPAGRYGRQAGWGENGCDPRLSWDGRGQDGREVPAGVYLVRLRAGGTETVKKILYRGR